MYKPRSIMFGTTAMLVLALGLLLPAQGQRVADTSAATGDVYKLKMVSDVCSGVKYVAWRTAPCNVTEGTIPGPYIGSDSDDLYVSWSVRLLDATDVRGRIVSLANAVVQQGGGGNGICRGYLTPQYPTACYGEGLGSRQQKAITLQSVNPGSGAYGWVMERAGTGRDNTFYIVAKERELPLCGKTDNYKYLSAVDPCADVTKRQMELRKEIVPPSGLIGTRSEFELILVTKAPASDTAPVVTFTTPGPVVGRRRLLAPSPLVVRIAQPLVGDFCSSYDIKVKKGGVEVASETINAGVGGSVTQYGVEAAECGVEYLVEVKGTKPIDWVTPLTTASITVC